MSGRSLLVVAAIAAVCIALAIWGQRSSAPETSAGALLMPDLAQAINSVERITVTAAGAETVATIERGADGWGVVEKGGYPADVAKIRALLVALAQAEIVEEKTGDPAFYDRLGVEAVELPASGGTAVEIGGEGLDIPRLILGDEANAASRYVRRADEPTSYLIDRNPDVPRSAAQWLVPEIVDVRGARVRGVTIEHADGERVVLAKSAPGQTNFEVSDVPEGRELLYPGVANVTGNGLRELALDDVARVPETAPAPDVVTEFRTFDGLVIEMTGTTYDGEPWVAFAARYEPPTAEDESADAPDADSADSSADAPAEASDAAAGGDAEAVDAQAQAEEINTRLSGWRFRIPSHQYDQLTRRLSDLLEAPG